MALGRAGSPARAVETIEATVAALPTNDSVYRLGHPLAGSGEVERARSVLEERSRRPATGRSYDVAQLLFRLCVELRDPEAFRAHTRAPSPGDLEPWRAALVT